MPEAELTKIGSVSMRYGTSDKIQDVDLGDNFFDKELILQVDKIDGEYKYKLFQMVKEDFEDEETQYKLLNIPFRDDILDILRPENNGNINEFIEGSAANIESPTYLKLNTDIDWDGDNKKYVIKSFIKIDNNTLQINQSTGNDDPAIGLKNINGSSLDIYTLNYHFKIDKYGRAYNFERTGSDYQEKILNNTALQDYYLDRIKSNTGTIQIHGNIKSNISLIEKAYSSSPAINKIQIGYLYDSESQANDPNHTEYGTMNRYQKIVGYLDLTTADTFDDFVIVEIYTESIAASYLKDSATIKSGTIYRYEIINHRLCLTNLLNKNEVEPIYNIVSPQVVNIGDLTDNNMLGTNSNNYFLGKGSIPFITENFVTATGRTFLLRDNTIYNIEIDYSLICNIPNNEKSSCCGKIRFGIMDKEIIGNNIIYETFSSDNYTSEVVPNVYIGTAGKLCIEYISDPNDNSEKMFSGHINILNETIKKPNSN